jgi:hypothetical protein
MIEPANPYASPEADLSVPTDSGLLRTTGIGLSLIFCGVVTAFLAFMAVLVSPIVLSFGQQPSGSPGGLSSCGVILKVGGIVMAIGGLLSFAGHIVCLFTPSQSRARSYNIFAVILQTLSIPLIVFLAIHGLATDPTLFNWASILIMLFCLSAAVFFVLFIRKLCDYIGRFDLVNMARNLLILVFLLLGVAGVMFAGVFLLKNDGFRYLVIVLFIGGLLCFVTYAVLINALGRELLRKEPRRKPPAIFGLTRHD